MSTRCSVVHSEALSQLPESRLVIHQVMRADVTELKFIWLFCGYRERRQAAARICDMCQKLTHVTFELATKRGKEEKRKRGILDDGAHGHTHTPETLQRKYFGRVEALKISRSDRPAARNCGYRKNN